MYLVDSHIHVTMLNYEGLQAMAEGGVKKIITCAIVLGAQHAESYFDHFSSTTGFYRKNAKSLGVELYSTIGVHPAGIPKDWTRVIDALPALLDTEGVVGIGEIGMNSGSQLEQDVLRAQFEIARDKNKPVIVHIPFENRLPIFELTLNIANATGIPPHLLIIDHANLDIIDQITEYGAIPGVTIRSRNVTLDILTENIDKFSAGMINSDFSNLFPNDPTAVIKAYKHLKNEGIDEDIINSLTRNRSERVFSI